MPLLVLSQAVFGGHLPAPDLDVGQFLVAHELVDHRDRHAEFTGRIFDVHLTTAATSHFWVDAGGTGLSAMRPPIPVAVSCSSGCGTTIPCQPVSPPDRPPVRANGRTLMPDRGLPKGSSIQQRRSSCRKECWFHSRRPNPTNSQYPCPYPPSSSR